jgi:hypothetical protein
MIAEEENKSNDGLVIIDKDIKAGSRLEKLFAFIQLLGFFIQVVNIAMNITYYYNSKFYNDDIFESFRVFLYLRPIVIGAFTFNVAIQSFIKWRKIKKELSQNSSNA